MLFPTIDFGLFFCLSFALVWALNAFNDFKKIVLLALSLAFYASWNWRFLLLLIASGAISYLVALYVEGGRPFRRAALSLGIALDLAILGYFKYLNFFIAQAMTASHAHRRRLAAQLRQRDAAGRDLVPHLSRHLLHS